MKQVKIKNNYWLFFVGALALILPLFLSTAANAVPTLKLSSGATTVTIVDGQVAAPGIAPDSNPEVGAITFIGAVGAFNINVSTGLTKPASGTADVPNLDLNSIDNTNATAGGTLTILWSDTDFNSDPGSPSAVFHVGGTLDAPANSSLTTKAYYDTANNALATTTMIATLGPFGPGSYSGTTSGLLPVGDPDGYSLTLEAILNFKEGAVGGASFDAQLKAVPEPGTVLLLGSGLACMGLFLMRGRKRSA